VLGWSERANRATCDLCRTGRSRLHDAALLLEDWPAGLQRVGRESTGMRCSTIA
jgi:hypothetical protein